ncbi:MAG TPA: class I SAM-dependent methyltransferase [Salinimicrobium sp.]|nr:class I SAM-dependent methyltransferase [Salinimicrobium sp.]
MGNIKDQQDVFGQAVKDFYQKGKAEDIKVHSPDFDDDVIPVDYLFRSYSEMPFLEQKALELCSGKILDVGCGAGSHSLYLQNEKNLEVMGIDTSPGAIEVCKSRGIKNTKEISFYELTGEKFNSILLLMNGTGIIGKLNNLDNFFSHLRNLLNPEGQVLLDSSDLQYLFDRDEEQGIGIDAAKPYYGELQYRLSYKNFSSKKFDWLFLDYNSLNLACINNGFDCELLEEGEHYDYLAKLKLMNS